MRRNREVARQPVLTATKQTERPVSGSVIAMLNGIFGSILPGAVVRELPKSWHMPERMAAHIMGETSLRA